ncbi:MAG: hypothetical protein H0T71_02510 [Acidobacteria bacterium]|nr:hypothetical protein [Acidobacteriota bacterium]
MRSVVARMLCSSAVLLSVVITGAQERPATPAQADPRIGLKPGLHDAGTAARGLELVASLPKPAGFDKLDGGLDFANSDLAFQGNHVFMGNFAGFNSYDIENTRKPRLVTSVACPGGQGDLSVFGNLLFMSVEQTRGRVDCGLQGVNDPVSKERFRGVRIFDITDISKPRQVAAVQTCRGSHTHTLVTARTDKAHVYVYGSGTGGVRAGEELEGCTGGDPKDDQNTALFSIDVIKVPLANPEQAAIVNRPRIFADTTTGAIAGLWTGGDHGPGTQRTSTTNQCHDITVYSEVGLAAGACSGNGILMDISDPVNPRRLDHVSDKNFAYWHSAAFNNDGTKVIFTDEWGGGTRPRCRETDLPTWGANAIFDIVDKKMKFGGYYKLPVAQTETENCVAHNGSLIPVPGRDIKVQGWYQGGVSMFDFTDSANPIEIAFFDRGPIDEKQLITGGFWSAYWYNGHIYGAEIARGIDIFRLTPTEHLTQNEIDAAVQVRMTEFNTQAQPRLTWPANFITARAYVDQLARSKALSAERLAALRAGIDRADRQGASRADLDAANNLATQLERDAATGKGTDAERMKSLAATIKGRLARLR